MTGLGTPTALYPTLVRGRTIPVRAGLSIRVSIAPPSPAAGRRGAATGSPGGLGRGVEALDLPTGATPTAIARGAATVPPAVSAPGDRVAGELASIRARTALPMHELARLCGVGRRQAYNLLDGGPTEPRRAAAIRRVAALIEGWSALLPGPEALRSALLAPLDPAGRCFVDLAADPGPGGLAAAAAAMDGYLARLAGARPAQRTSPARGDAAGAARLLAEMHGEAGPRGRG